MMNKPSVSARYQVPPLCSSAAYATWGGLPLLDDANSCAETLKVILSIATEPTFRPKTHSTPSQRLILFPSEFTFHAGTPSISSISDASPNWTDRVFQLCSSGHEDAALKEISLATAKFKANQEFAKLSADLKNLELEKLSDIVLVALLRNTFSIRSQISCWNSLLSQIEQLLLERKREPRYLLRGLKQYL